MLRSLFFGGFNLQQLIAMRAAFIQNMKSPSANKQWIKDRLLEIVEEMKFIFSEVREGNFLSLNIPRLMGGIGLSKSMKGVDGFSKSGTIVGVQREGKGWVLLLEMGNGEPPYPHALHEVQIMERADWFVIPT